MFLSIIIPIYNDEKFLNECLDSCLNQDYPQDDYEIICVDDGSTDRTPEMLREYAEKYPNIRLVFKEHGKGGRTSGFPFAKGDYIWFVDHDDVAAPNAIPELKKIVDQNPDCERVSFPYYQFFDHMTEEERKLMHSGSLSANDDNKLSDMVVWNSIFQRRFLLDHDIDPTSKWIRQAGEFWGIPNFKVYASDTIFVRECIENGIRSTQMEGRPLYHYRRHENSESISYSPESMRKRELLQFNRVLVYLHRALLKRSSYLQQRQTRGQASPETTADAVVSLRWATGYLASLSREYWRKGMDLACEKDAFFPRRIPEYHFTYWNYMRQRSWRERIKPSTTAFYFSYCEFGIRFLRLSLAFVRLGAHNQFIKKVNSKYRKHVAMKKGVHQTTTEEK